MEKRLFRNEHDKVIAGVSSGVAAYMEVDVTIIRLLFVLSTIFLMGTGILVYLVMWIVVPVNTDPTARYRKFNDFFQESKKSSTVNDPGTFSQTDIPAPGSTQNWSSSTFNAEQVQTPHQPDYSFIKKNSDTGRTVGGLFLLVIGLYFLMNEFDIIPYWFSLGKLWPLIFIAIGISFVAKSKRKDPWEDWKEQQETPSSTPVTEKPRDVNEGNSTSSTTNEANTPL
jgi:phage shock protein C